MRRAADQSTHIHSRKFQLSTVTLDSLLRPQKMGQCHQNKPSRKCSVSGCQWKWYKQVQFNKCNPTTKFDNEGIFLSKTAATSKSLPDGWHWSYNTIQLYCLCVQKFAFWLVIYIKTFQFYTYFLLKSSLWWIVSLSQIQCMQSPHLLWFTSGGVYVPCIYTYTHARLKLP